MHDDDVTTCLDLKKTDVVSTSNSLLLTLDLLAPTSTFYVRIYGEGISCSAMGTLQGVPTLVILQQTAFGKTGEGRCEPFCGPPGHCRLQEALTGVEGEALCSFLCDCTNGCDSVSLAIGAASFAKGNALKICDLDVSSL